MLARGGDASDYWRRRGGRMYDRRWWEFVRVAPNRTARMRCDRRRVKGDRGLGEALPDGPVGWRDRRGVG